MLQGHPEAGKLWEKHVTAILRSPHFGFKSTTHDRSICSATFEGTRILLLRQVDNFAVACPNEDLAKRLCNQIGKALQLPSEDAPPFCWMKKNDVAKMRQAGTAPATGTTVYCPISLWCAVTYKRCSAVDTTNTLLRANVHLALRSDLCRIYCAIYLCCIWNSECS